MLYFGICELLKLWKQTLLMALQIGIIMFLTVAAVTIYKEQTVKYDYIKDFLHKDGALIHLNAQEVYNAGGTEKYFESFGVGEYHYNLQDQLFLDEEGAPYFKMYAYDELLSRYEPGLSEGVWYTKAKKTEGTIEAVVSKNSVGVKLGDTIKLYFNEEPVKVHICGVLADETSFYGTNGLSSYGSFFDLYTYYENAREDINSTEAGMFFLSLEDLKDVTPFECAPWGNVLVSFKDDLSENAKKKALLDWGRTSVVIDFKTVTERTEGIINSKMAEILPVFIGAFFLVTLSITCLSAIDTLMSVKSYAVFFACGMEWKKGVYISIIKSVLTCLMGTAVMFLLYYISILTKLNDTILFELGLWQILACVLVCLFMVVVSCIMPRRLLKNNQPAKVLRVSRQ